MNCLNQWYCIILKQDILNIFDVMSEINDGVECVTFPGKGQGLVAKQAFEVGDVVLRETPIVDMPQSIFDLEEPDRVERWLDRKINAMTSSQRQQFFDLSGT